VLAIAVEQAGRWHLHGQSLGISVNVGTVDVVDATFPNFVEEVLARNQLPASLLTIEITEDSVIEDPVRTAQIVARLRQFGTKVSIDDFGAGYASLSLLRELDLDELKLDKSLVDEVDTSSRQKALVRAAVGLAHALGLSLVAEGVESADAWRELQLLDCDVAQGYLVSRPLSAIDLEAWLEAQRRRLPTNRPAPVVLRSPVPVVPSPTYVPPLRRRPRTLPAQQWAAHPPASLPAPAVTRAAS
jgi:diguanylate cyclase